MSETAIEVAGLGRCFGAVWAVRGVDLSVKCGEIFGVLGPNGAGKSTTIRMLCGLLRPSEGQGRVLGRDLESEGEAIKADIGYMTQAFSLYRDLSAEENLRFHAGIHGLGFRAGAKAVERQLERFSLGERRKQLVAILSGGWKQRLALACATIHNPRLLFLDEPTAGVDPVSRREFWQEIQLLARAGTTVLVTTHYMEESEQCHRLAFIFHGRLLGSGTPAEMVSRCGLSAALGPAPETTALERLRAEPGLVEASFLGPRLRVLAGPGFRALELAGRSLGPGFLEERVSVEDAFIYLARQGLKP